MSRKKKATNFFEYTVSFTVSKTGQQLTEKYIQKDDPNIEHILRTVIEFYFGQIQDFEIVSQVSYTA